MKILFAFSFMDSFLEGADKFVKFFPVKGGVGGIMPPTKNKAAEGSLLALASRGRVGGVAFARGAALARKCSFPHPTHALRGDSPRSPLFLGGLAPQPPLHGSLTNSP